MQQYAGHTGDYDLCSFDCSCKLRVPVGDDDMVSVLVENLGRCSQDVHRN